LFAVTLLRNTKRPPNTKSTTPDAPLFIVTGLLGITVVEPAKLVSEPAGTNSTPSPSLASTDRDYVNGTGALRTASLDPIKQVTGFFLNMKKGEIKEGFAGFEQYVKDEYQSLILGANIDFRYDTSEGDTTEVIVYVYGEQMRFILDDFLDHRGLPSPKPLEQIAKEHRIYWLGENTTAMHNNLD